MRRPSLHGLSTMYGKGCLPTPLDIKAKHYRLAPLAAPTIDWSVPYRIPAVLTQKNQDGSSSCTAQATTYYVEALNQIENGKNEQYSPRFIYSQTTLGYGQGAYIWKAMKIPQTGVASEASVPGGAETEAIMTDKSANGNAILEARADKYAVIPRGSIDTLAQIVKDYHGFVTGFNGHDGMFAPDGTVIDWSTSTWGHAVYVVGYEMHNGQKCLVFKNSWGSGWGTDGCGYFPEAFVGSGMMYDAYVYALTEDLDPSSMFKVVQVAGSPEVWLIRDGKKTHIYNQGALTSISSFANIVPITQADLDAIPDTGLELATLVKE